jgi:hypothetical protein
MGLWMKIQLHGSRSSVKNNSYLWLALFNSCSNNPGKSRRKSSAREKTLLGSWDLTNGPTLFEHRAVVHTMAQMFPSAS